MRPLVRGFTLPAAIFVLVVLAALGAYIVNISTAHQTSLAFDVRGERAFQAAFAGKEWVRYQINDLAACPANTAWGSSTYSLGFPGTEVLGSFSATVECRLLESTNVAGVATSLFEVRVTACGPAASSEPKCPGSATSDSYVERQIQAVIAL